MVAMATITSSFSIPSVLSFLLFLSSILEPTSSIPSVHEEFLECLPLHSNTSVPVYTPNTSSYSTILELSIQNLRFLSPTTPKPSLIITPLQYSHVQAAVICSRKHGFQIKIRSGGHDYDGLSYTSDVPFVIIDMFNLRSVDVNIEDASAWVQSGATIGEVYYNIAQKSRNLGFPAGICPTVGVGGHFSGGGYGTLLRKYGMAADNVIDAEIVTVDGQILDKNSMGEDLFWAIRGGGGGSFGVILSWKIRLVSVPTTVTVFTIDKTLEQGATSLVYKWQSVANKLPKDLFIRVLLKVTNSTTQDGRNKTIQASFNSIFLGRAEELLVVMEERFPELRLGHQDCSEMSWIQSILYFAGFPANGPQDVLLSRARPKDFFKAKSDYVKEPISKTKLEGIWRMMLEEEEPEVIFSPYGGRMSEISEYAIPFPHRDGNLYKIQYLVYWEEQGFKASKKHINWIRKLYKYMTPYVSKSPRDSYINYRDIDLGQSKNGTASYSQAKGWGSKYFRHNYEKLVYVKSKVDPSNLFRNEQSIPSISSLGY